jgi:hypothetical protein
MGEWRERLERRLNGPVPVEDPMEVARRHNREVLGLGLRKKWEVVVDGVTSCVSWKPGPTDEMAEALRAADRAEREARLDQWGLGIWGGRESIDDVVRRQNRRR